MHLTDSVTEHFRITAKQKDALKRLNIETLYDILLHVPQRYEDVAAAVSISDIPTGENVTVYGELTDVEKKLVWKTKKYMVDARLTDRTGSISIRWFNQPYAENIFKHARFVKVTGKTTGTGKGYFANPRVEELSTLPDIGMFSDDNETRTGAPIPIYAETFGVTSYWFARAAQKILTSTDLSHVADPVPESVRAAYHLPSLASALVFAHTPKNMKDAETARKRFSFDDIFIIQVARAQDRAANTREQAPRIVCDEKKLHDFLTHFPWPLTGAQERATKEIMYDFNQPYPMARLLEGDVGSGKTIVAAATAHMVATSAPSHNKNARLQIAYMAPTEILAQQQFSEFVSLFSKLKLPYPMQVGLLTGSGCLKYPSKTNPNAATKISRAQLLKWVESGECTLVLGTHALIQKAVKFRDLAYVIIDEQHRYGVNQRKALVAKGALTPHFLSMTATPIPRTLALTIYGDLDLSVLDEMPKGRKPVETKAVTSAKRNDVYAAVRTELDTGRQAYVICPRIDEPDPTKALALNVKSATAEYKKLGTGPFKDYTLGLLHGKLKPTEKDAVMKDFASGKVQILVATSVVEVGVNVPNASVIIIEGAERFGLSQLHQLRGRVRRSTHQPYCYLFASDGSSTARLKILEKNADGFALAEEDLKLRGTGALSGGKQWGVSDLAMDALQNPRLVEAARSAAHEVVADDPELLKHPTLKARVRALGTQVHFE